MPREERVTARSVSRKKPARNAKPALGLREQNKLDKRERIRAAAAELFKRHGYGAATMRQIAQRAHVGLGTLFNYAEDKRDLVFLIFNVELAAIIEQITLATDMSTARWIRGLRVWLATHEA